MLFLLNRAIMAPEPHLGANSLLEGIVSDLRVNRSLMGQRVNRDIESQLLAIVRANALTLVAGVIGAEGTAEAVLAHDGNEIPFVEEAFELDIARFVEAT